VTCSRVVVQQEKVDRVIGFEPTTSDHEELSSISNKLQALLRLKEREKQEEAIIQLEDTQSLLQRD
jgi:hypothetical protein